MINLVVAWRWRGKADECCAANRNVGMVGVTINGRDDWAMPFPDFGERTKNKQFLSRSESERESPSPRPSFLSFFPSSPPPFSVLHSIRSPLLLCSSLLPTLPLAFLSSTSPLSSIHSFSSTCFSSVRDLPSFSSAA